MMAAPTYPCPVCDTPAPWAGRKGLTGHECSECSRCHLVRTCDNTDYVDLWQCRSPYAWWNQDGEAGEHNDGGSEWNFMDRTFVDLTNLERNGSHRTALMMERSRWRSLELCRREADEQRRAS